MSLRILLTGGTGSFAKAFIPSALARGCTRLVALARHEKEMHELEVEFGQHDVMRFYLGDIRDVERLKMACGSEISTIVHAGALKRIEQAERDPIEAIKTNVDGSANVVLAALATPSVKRCVLLSTDKAYAPVNIYGATKLCAERLFIAANGLAAGRCTFTIARYGNIWGSRGSVVRVWREELRQGKPIKVRNADATRFFMPIEQSVQVVWGALAAPPGTVVMPQLRAYRLGDLALAMAGDPGRIIHTPMPDYEKPHETLDGITYSNQVAQLTINELQHELERLP